MQFQSVGWKKGELVEQEASGFLRQTAEGDIMVGFSQPCAQKVFAAEDIS